MKNLLHTLLTLVTLFIVTLQAYAQLADVTYSVRVGNILSKEGGALGPCWEAGNEEYTGYGGFYDDINGTLVQSSCLTCDFNGNCNYGGGTFLGTRSNNSYQLFYNLDAFEDDAGAQCNFNSGDDCRNNGTIGFLYFREYVAPSNGAYISGPQASLGSHELRLDYTWKYSGTSSLLTTACAAQTSTYASGAIRSWSVNLVAGRTYRFSTTGLTTEDTYLRVVGSDGYTVVTSNDDFGGSLQSQVDITAATSGTYYVELAAFSSSNARGVFLLNAGSLRYEDISTPAVNGGTIAANTTLCTGGNASLVSSAAATGGFDGSVSYAWESSPNGTTWSAITGANSATYNALALTSTTYYRRKATDCKGTVGYSNTVTVTVVADPTVSLSAAPATICIGGSSVLNASASGGTGTISYQWQQFIAGSWQGISGSGSSYLVSPASNTDYRVLVSTGVSGCNGNATQTISVIADPTVSITSTNVSCFGASNAAASAVVSGGTSGNSYNFDWAPGAPSGDGTSSISNLPGGTYTLSVSGAYGCNASGSVNISEPTALSASSTSGSILCNGGSTTVTVSGSGGTAPYTGTGTFTVGAGTYSYTVTDANGCTATTSITVTEPTVLSAVSSSGSIACNGGTTTVTVSGSGGTAPYTGTGTYTVGAGTYSYTVTDANGCTATTNITVSEPTLLTASSSSGSIVCNGGTTTVTVSGSGGTAPYSGTGNYTVGAGTYSYTVTDANGCSSTTSLTITQPTPLVATITSNAPNTTICTGGTAQLTASVSGGLGNVNYQWQYQDNNGNWINVSGWSANNVATPFTNTRNASPSATRAYRIVVTSVASATCSVTATQLVTVVADPVITITSTNVTCFGASNGTATATLTGGLPLNYGYNWSSNDGISTNNNPAGDGTLSVTGLFPAPWVINTTVSGSNFGCYAEASVTITQPDALVASSSAPAILCNGGTSTATVSATGGTAPYTGTGSYSNLSAGNYSYTVTDANGCTANTSVTITEPTVLTASSSTSDFNGFGVSCNGGNNGSIAVSASGGVAPYGATGLYNNLSAGTYSYTVTDANGCTASTSNTITEPTALTASSSTSDFNGFGVSCYGGNNGNIAVSASGGVAPYAATGSYNNLSAGTYSYTVTDANGCTASTSSTITEPSLLTAGILGSDYNGYGVSCYQSTDGSADATANGGVAGYSYSWSNGATTEDLSGLGAGNYTVVVTDANGCTASADVTLAEPTKVNISATNTAIACFGGNSTVTVNTWGGVTPYSVDDEGTYLVNAGTYTYDVTDANGCSASTDITIGQPTLLVASSSTSDYNGYGVSCNGGSNGEVVVSATGGTAPYSGIGNNTGLGAGVYSYTVTDANGCTASTSSTITEPTLLTAGVVGSDYNGYGVSCYQSTDGSADATANGGVAGYSYSWSSGSTTEDLSGLGAGNYSVVVTDANGCTASADVTLVEPTKVNISATNTSIACFGQTSDVTVTTWGGVTPYSVNDAGTYTVNAGTYTYDVVDANGCSASTSISISQPSLLTVNAGSDETVFFGYGPMECADLDATINGGTQAYNVVWTSTASGGGIGASYTACPTSNEVYTVSVVDANGCTATDELSICVVDVTCYAGNSSIQKVQMCQVPPGNPANAHTICIDASAVPAHLAIGCQLGECGELAAACSGSAAKSLETEELAAALVAYPNPTENTTTVSVTLTKGGNYSVEMYDMMGKLVKTVYAGSFEDYENLEFDVDMTNLQTGVYMISVSNGDQKIENIRVMKN